MKRLVFKIVLFLILGALTTLSISWYLAAGSVSRSWYRFGEEGYSDIGDRGYWKTRRKDWFGRIRLRSMWAYEWGGSLTISGGLPPSHDLTPEWALTIKHVVPGEINNADVIAEATGWPVLAMRSHYEMLPAVINDTGKYEFPIHAPQGILISSDGDLNRLILPVQPIWSGFAVNTIFYGALIAVLWMLILTPFVLRRIIRSKRGHCIKCGYDLSGTEHNVCPECGSELSVSAKL